jgi:deoxyadenosine/deoxycytidine kinase
MNTLYPYIAIEGVIGVGKTTLATMLSKTYDTKLVLEQFGDNPFLPKFYQDPQQYAFPLELSFLAERFQQLSQQLTTPDLFHNCVISDYITEKSLIFSVKTLPPDVFTLYRQLFHIIFRNVPKPDLLVYLFAHPEKLKANIVKRGRDYEQNITLDYLHKIQTSYLEFITLLSEQRVLIMDVDAINFIDNTTDYQTICDKVVQEYPIGVHYC